METNQRDVATRVVVELKRHGHIAVFAGGCVRDEILGLEPSDYDVATSALPDEVESIFERTLPVGKAFGIIVVVIDGQTIEVATLRADGQYGDGRRPDSVRFVTSLEEDARRREFTMNAMFKDPTTGEIFDFFGGQKDLADGIIRAVGNAEERIDEDRLRMLRAVRFASRYGFEIDPALRSAIRKLAPELHRGPKALAWERISKEFRGILTSANPVIGLDFMMEFGLMAEGIPELLET
ncbi:MAG TPA: CCA tRNA nucleotidyltransferase, partial [Candidatus Melainabacteria bacterium]|nr:CCA tRNA nucleotidyltransferase [Candidatus Melainabacteria bacterium]